MGNRKVTATRVRCPVASVESGETVEFTGRHSKAAVRAHLTPVFLLTILWYGYTTGSPPSPKRPVQSTHYRKSKCRENIHSKESLRYDGESGDLQARSTGNSLSGMYVLVPDETFDLII